MEPQHPQPSAHANPLLAHLNDTDEAHASTRVDFAHPGAVTQPPIVATAPKPEPEPAPTPPPTPPGAPPPPVPPSSVPQVAPPAPKSPRNRRPLMVALVVVLVAALAGGGAYWWFKIRKPTSQNSNQSVTQNTTVEPLAPSGLVQKGASGQSLAAGASTKGPLELDFTMSTTANTGTLQPQVEVEPIGTAFSGQSNFQGANAGVNGGMVQAAVTVSGLKDGPYHWQARFVAGSTTGAWTVFGTGSGSDFNVDTQAPAAAIINRVDTKTVKAGATSVAVSANQPIISGTAEAGTVVALAILPDNQTATATTTAAGTWIVTPQQPLANGQHTLTITTTDAAGNTTSSSFTINVNAATAATTTLAPTGDNTLPPTLLGLAMVVIFGGGLIMAVRCGRTTV